ncbi:MAG TPA: murein biosynthesis integral membrane protein MurJ [Gammaproteobacteria bacterium]|nr:murein biosynthesis integral membrane protein MurJ [Gammaproteobacteria bacterium]
MKKKSLLKSIASVGSMTMLSRILGFVRDIIIARLFGAGIAADAFFVAFKIPNFMRRLFAEGAFSLAFVPVLSEYKTQREHDDVQKLVNHVCGVLGGVLFFITLVGVIAAPVLVMIFAPGFLDEPDRYSLTTDMLRITFPYIFFISLVAFAGGILNSYGQFAAPAFTPVFLNLSLIACAIWLAPLLDQPVMALAWGVFFGGLIQLLFQLPFLYRLRLLPRPRYKKNDEGVGRIIKLMIPALFGSSVAQINLLLDTLIASFLVAGSVSWLYFSDRLVEFPLGILGIAVATVILPNLSTKHAKKSAQEFSHTLDWALRLVIVLSVPAAAALAVLAGPMLATLFQYGEFSGDDVKMARMSLMAYSLGLVSFITIKVLATGFYARQDTKTPVKIGIIAMVANMGMNIALVFPLAHTGLALATSLSALLNAILLYRALCQEGVYQSEPGWMFLTLKVILATTAMVTVIWWGAGELNQWLEWSWYERAGQLFLWIAIGAIVYFTALLLMGIHPKQLLTQKH